MRRFRRPWTATTSDGRRPFAWCWRPCATGKRGRAKWRRRLPEADVLDILNKMVRQREESVRDYEEAGQLELAEQEREEMGIIAEFLPRQFDDTAMKTACEDVVRDISANGLRDMGRCMNALKKRYPGQMDFVRASCVVKDLLRTE